ncbi:putative quinol monooxygenase [Ruegeria sp. TM1040]|jgi:quinol monooxygenase YgiN|uniref:putative quinol monooxygenase n=1 Tax=Rhodobacterales TaxID=204455 RepID=UPI000046252A|nr:putative quinol monooxygenase [Ruegeria sp. TM1040]ABF63928.1 Antibiotic biosynthesis monooxygenase [Ruegeria sp. TM1040]
MAVLVIAELKTAYERRDTLLEFVQTLAAHSRAEPGCLSYRPMLDVDQAGTIVIVEKWQSAAALEAHGQTAHMADFKAELGGVEVSIETFDIANPS